LALFLVGLWISGCDQGRDITLTETSSVIKNSDPIVIGVLGSQHNHDSLLRGIQLAVKEINSNTAFQKYPLQINSYTLPESKNNEMGLIKNMVEDRSLLAVINALNTSYTTLADRILLLHKKIHIVIANTSMAVPQNSPLSFRIIPNDRIAARQFVDRMEWNWRNVAVIQERNDKRLMQTKAFVEAAAESNIRISQSVSFFPWENDIRQLLWNLRERIDKNQEFLDAIYIACNPLDMLHVIKQVRAMNIRAPIISSIDLQDISRLQAIGNAANGLLMASYFNPDSDDPQIHEFVKRFHAEYPAHHPDIWAARGYDTTWMVAKSIEIAKTVNAWEVASEMLLIERWHGVSGKIVFNIGGDVKEYTPYYLKQYCNGRFVYLAEDQPIPPCPPCQ
jgi:ABC-type branched-subunit amino acid transport system substrate-binding protein